MDRPEYVKCVRRTAKGAEHKAWCGRDTPRTEFAFESIDHATENTLAGGRLVACPDCVKAITAAMTESPQGEPVAALEAEIARLEALNAQLQDSLSQSQSLLARALTDLASKIEDDTTMAEWLPFNVIPGYRRPDHPWLHETIEIRNASGEISRWKYADLPPWFNINGCFWRPAQGTSE